MLTGFALALFCIVFTIVYEQFSHGAFSVPMRFMFLFPLIGCGLLGLLGILTPLSAYVHRLAFNLWNTAVATFTLGCLFRGIVNISGRFTKMDRLYWILGSALAVLALTAEIITLLRNRRNSI